MYLAFLSLKEKQQQIQDLQNQKAYEQEMYQKSMRDAEMKREAMKIEAQEKAMKRTQDLRQASTRGKLAGQWLHNEQAVSA